MINENDDTDMKHCHELLIDIQLYYECPDKQSGPGSRHLLSIYRPCYELPFYAKVNVNVFFDADDRRHGHVVRVSGKLGSGFGIGFNNNNFTAWLGTQAFVCAQN